MIGARLGVRVARFDAVRLGARCALPRLVLLGLAALGLALLGCGLVGCGDDASLQTRDAGAELDGESVGWALAEPTAPTPPLLKCPDGWRSVTQGSDPSVCEPWPVTGRARCADHEMHLPGTPGCATVGSACPSDDYSASLPSSGVLYAQAGTSGGDGSKGLPFGTIAQASAVASSGTVIALAAGTYDEAVVLGEGVTLRGKCAQSTVLTLTGGVEGASVVRLSSGSALHDVTVRGGPSIGVHVDDDATAVIEGVVVDAAPRHGVYLGSGSTLTASDLAVRRCGHLDDHVSAGIRASEGAALTVSRTVVADGIGDGIVGDRDTTIAVADVAVLDHRGALEQPQSASGNGVGLRATAGSQFSATACVVERAERAAAWSRRPGSSLKLESCVLRDTRAEPNDNYNGLGGLVSDSAHLQIENSLIERTSRAGVRTHTSGQATLTDVVIRDVQRQENSGAGGHGLLVGSRCTVTLSRAAFLRTHHAAIVMRFGAELLAEDLIVSDVGSRTPFLSGGHGLTLDPGSSTTVRRALIAGARETGIAAFGTATASLEDLVVRDGAGREADGALGAGITVSRASLTLTRVLIDDNPRIGLWFGDGSTVVGSDVRVRSTREQDCAQDTCTDTPFGVGLGAYQSSRTQLRRFAIETSSLCGVQLATEGALDLAQGTVSGSPIGVCIQNEGYDVGRLSHEVAYVDNDFNLQAVTLPIPDAAPPVGTGGN